MRRRGSGRPQGRGARAACQSEERTPHACCPTGDCRACVRCAPRTVILVGDMTASPSPSPSPWSRPDDAVRQAQLDVMKRQATGLLALAAVVFVGASLYEGQFPWLGYVRATAEASLVGGLADRSEEHTSELQSRENLVCRLLLEKKKKRIQYKQTN